MIETKAVVSISTVNYENGKLAASFFVANIENGFGHGGHCEITIETEPFLRTKLVGNIPS